MLCRVAELWTRKGGAEVQGHRSAGICIRRWGCERNGVLVDAFVHVNVVSGSVLNDASKRERAVGCRLDTMRGTVNMLLREDDGRVDAVTVFAKDHSVQCKGRVYKNNEEIATIS